MSDLSSSYATISNLKTALVTGASSGIGKALAKELFVKGYTVFAGARRVDAMADLASLGITTVSLDVTDQASVNNVFDQIKGQAGRLDILFNNAGTSCTFPATDLEIDDAQACFDVNFFGVVRVTKAAIPLLKESKGTIVQTGSVAAILPFPFGSIYGASKAALKQYSDILRVELKPFGINVIVLTVAAVSTDIADTRPLPANSLYLEIEDGVQARRSMAKDHAPMDPAEFARRVVPQTIALNPKRQIWDGSNTWLLWFLSCFPRFVIEILFYYKFQLAKLGNLLAKAKRS